MISSDLNMFFNYSVLILTVVIGLTTARSGLHSEQSAPPSRVQQCREGCLEKFSTDDLACLQGPECSMCWDQCAAPSKIDTSTTLTWGLHTISMVRHGSLVSADVAWPPSNSPSQCLVTWEVAGGGLMGNLLTDSSTVQLSLWPETKYKVQVTCKNKRTELVTRSQPLTLDTGNAIVMVRIPIVSTTASKLFPQITTTLDGIVDPSMDLELNQDGHHYLHSNHKQAKILADLDLWTTDDGHKEVIFGVCAAILVFLCILAVVILSSRQASITDKESLIDNEFSVDIQTQTVHHAKVTHF